MRALVCYQFSRINPILYAGNNPLPQQKIEKLPIIETFLKPILNTDISRAASVNKAMKPTSYPGIFLLFDILSVYQPRSQGLSTFCTGRRRLQLIRKPRSPGIEVGSLQHVEKAVFYLGSLFSGFLFGVSVFRYFIWGPSFPVFYLGSLFSGFFIWGSCFPGFLFGVPQCPTQGSGKVPPLGPPRFQKVTGPGVPVCRTNEQRAGSNGFSTFRKRLSIATSNGSTKRLENVKKTLYFALDNRVNKLILSFEKIRITSI